MKQKTTGHPDSATTGPTGAPCSRRAAMIGGLASLVASYLPSPAMAAATSVAKPAADPFSSIEGPLITAAFNRLIPADASGPGAGDAGGLKYVEHLVRHAYTNDYRGPNNPWSNVREAYRTGCAALERHCKRAHGASFHELSGDLQDAVLTLLEADRIDGLPQAAQFFGLLRQHAIESMFGDPAYGGNDAGVGWRLLRFPGVRVAFQPEDAALGQPTTLDLRSFAEFSFFSRDGV